MMTSVLLDVTDVDAYTLHNIEADVINTNLCINKQIPNNLANMGVSAYRKMKDKERDTPERREYKKEYIRRYYRENKDKWKNYNIV